MPNRKDSTGSSAKRPGEERRHSRVQSEPEPPYSGQKLEKPGKEAEMKEQPRWKAPDYRPAGKLTGRVALITGGDSGIGRAVAVLFAREGADVAINYLPEEQEDAQVARDAIGAEGRRSLLIPGDLTDPAVCKECVEKTVREFGRLDILVSNAAYQNRKEDVTEITDEEWDRTLKTNIYAYFYLVRAAVPHMKPGSSIIATGSQVALKGSAQLLDYGATKGAIHVFTQSLAQQLIDKGIRCNVVAPGPVWTPLNPADEGLPPDKVAKFGKKQPIGRAAQPEEIAPAYVFFASVADSSFVTGVVLPETGGLI